MDPRSSLELVEQLQVGNLHLSPPSAGSGSTSEEGIPPKALRQYLCPVSEKVKGSLGFAVQGQWSFFFTYSGFVVCPFFPNQKLLRGQSSMEESLKNFIQQGK